MKALMQAGLTAWLTKMSQLFKGTAGNLDNLLYVDNPNGRFSFKKDPAVKEINVATTADGVTAAKNSVEALGATVGYVVINQFNKTIETYDPATSTWSSSTTTYETYVLPSRYYYSPWNQTVWLTTSYGALQRFMTTGLTKIG